MAIIDWAFDAPHQPNHHARLFHRTAQQGELSLSFHSAPGFQIVWIREGSGVYNVMGTRYPFGAGDVFLFTERETHYVSAVSEQPVLRMSSLLFTREFISSEKDFGLYPSYLRIYTDRSLEYTNRFLANDPRTANYFQALADIEGYALQEKKELAAMQIRARLLMLLAQITVDHGELINQAKPFEGHAVEKVRQAIDYMDEHFREELTLDQIALSAGLTRNYLSSAFKRTQGMTPWDYLTTKRVTCAISLMKQEGCSVTEAALKSGFNNTTNFNRAFRKYTGRTPTEYLHTRIGH